MEVLVVFAMNLKEKRKKKTQCIPKSIMKREKRLWHRFLVPVALWTTQATFILHAVTRLLKTCASFASKYVLTVYNNICSVLVKIEVDGSCSKLRITAMKKLEIKRIFRSYLLASYNTATGRRVDSPGPPGLCNIYKNAGLENTWEVCGGSCSRDQSTTRGDNSNLNSHCEECWATESACVRALENRDLKLPDVDHVIFSGVIYCDKTPPEKFKN